MDNNGKKLSKREFLEYIDKTDKQDIANLKTKINDEFRKNPDDINWDLVIECMQAITLLRFK